jgi:hypothetical protein
MAPQQPNSSPYIPNPWMTMTDLANAWDLPQASFDPNAEVTNSAPMNPSGLPSNAEDPTQQGLQDLMKMDPGGLNAWGGSASVKGSPNMNWSKYNQLQDQYRQRGAEELQSQRDYLNHLKEQIGQMPKDQIQPDLTGLMSLADAWNNGKTRMASDYRKPETPEELRARQMAMEEKVLGSQNNLSKDELGLLKGQLDDELRKQMIMGHFGMANSAKKEAGDDKVLNTLQQNMIKDKNYVQLQGVTNAADGIRDMIAAAQAPGGGFSAQNLKIHMARLATGGQRLNIPEIQAQTGDPAFQAKMKQFISTAESGTVTPENAAEMLRYIDEMDSAAERRLGHYEMDYANKVRARTNYDLPTAYERLTGKQFKMKEPSRKAPRLNQMDPSKMTREQKIEFLQQ